MISETSKEHLTQTNLPSTQPIQGYSPNIFLVVLPSDSYTQTLQEARTRVELQLNQVSLLLPISQAIIRKIFLYLIKMEK